MTIKATYFDGTSAFGHDVELLAEGEQIALTGYTAARRYLRGEARMAEPFAAAPCVVDFADGSHCEVPSGQRAALAELMRYVPSRIERWQGRWMAAVAAVAVMIGFAALAYFKGIPALSVVIVDNMPVSAEMRLGDVAQRGFEAQMLKRSNFSDQRLAEIAAVFESVRPAARRVPVRLLVRDAPQIGANAFALPNGTIVVTDDLVKALIGKGEVPEAADQLAGIFAHEIGHIELRHSIRGLAQSSLTLAGSWALFGDFSAVAAGLPALVSRLGYSREMEYEADAFSTPVLARAGHRPVALADALTALEHNDSEHPDPTAGLPDWMRVSLGFMSSHPGTPERVKRLQQMAR